ncbi:PREDICTED: NF-kappa-B-repressing factor [Bactrocera latifrons]|uniref:NF-kappa-B-repressing factor n=2 Tax=Bactrocera latifrons TaxID=174628 RepID=A0A0K8V390_BACLA|nr:PREDICTED: NF-kappa-B-repressing factor [Bactrocera latifrons]
MASSSKNIKNNEEFPTDWDIDYYRADHESDEHWQMRRHFMELHKDKFPEDRLVCLAAVFTNMEFMGCRYPSETMQLVAELSKEVVKDYRKSRETRLKRTFVAASEAAEARVKARSGGHSGQQQNLNRNNSDNSKLSSMHKSNNLFEGLPFGKFVLFLIGGRSCVRMSAQRCNIEYEEKEVEGPNNTKKINMFLNGKLVSDACEENVKAAKAQVFNNALDVLQHKCYSIKPNPMRDTIKINKSNNEIVCGVVKQQADNAEDKKLDASNKGYKMMKLMGWTGGGLGSKTQGREEPVGYLLKNNRAGLGNEACKLDRKYFRQILQNYLESEDIRELQFEPSFTKEERAMLHEIAGKFNLKSTSHGKDAERRLVISKKTITNEQILSEILLKKNPSYIDKYFVQVPDAKARFYPEHTEKLDLDI